MKTTLRLMSLMPVLMIAITSFGFASAEEEKIEIKWLGYYTSNIPVEEETYAEHIIEEYFGVEITPVTDVTSENMDVFIASGDILDVTCYATYLNSDVSYMYDQSLIRDFPEEWLWEYYPTGMQLLVDNVGEEFFENGNHLLNDSCVYIPYKTSTNTSEYVVIYRKD